MDKLKAIYKDRLSLNSIDSEDCVLDAMRLAYNQAIQDAVNNAEVSYEKNHEYGSYETIVDNDSILKLKIK